MEGASENIDSVLNPGSSTEIYRDSCLVRRALNSGWLTPQKRAALQQKAHELALTLCNQDNAKAFTSLAKLIESSYQFDVKLAERELIREEKAERERQSLEAKNVAAVAIGRVADAVTSRRVEVGPDDRKAKLAERIRGIAGPSGE